MNLIEEHYNKNYQKLIQLMSFRAGTQWDGEDVVQEAYARAIKYYDSFDNSAFDNWFRTILNNCLKEHKNQEKGYSISISFEEDEVEGTPCNQYNQQIVQEINDLIATKSVAQMEVLGLYFNKGYSAIDISKISEHSHWAIHKMITRFKEELQELYK